MCPLQPSIGSCHRLAVHDIPVTIVKRRNWADYAEPEMPNFDVRLSCVKTHDASGETPPTLKLLVLVLYIAVGRTSLSLVLGNMVVARQILLIFNLLYLPCSVQFVNKNYCHAKNNLFMTC